MRNSLRDTIIRCERMGVPCVRDGIRYALVGGVVTCKAITQELPHTLRILHGTQDVGAIGYSYIQTLILPSTVKHVLLGAVQHCPYLTKVILENNSQLVEIQGLAFSYCQRLETVDFRRAKNLQHIGQEAFSHCEVLREIYLPSRQRSIISLSSFLHCPKLKQIHRPAV